MSGAFNYGISIQEAVRDICEETGKSEREVIGILDGIFMEFAVESYMRKPPFREELYLTAHRAEAGLARNVEIEAWQMEPHCTQLSNTRTSARLTLILLRRANRAEVIILRYR